MKNLIRNFVLKYVRCRMGHNHTLFRNDLFQEINDGMRSSFYEDNMPTRLSFTVMQVLQNDREFMEFVMSNNVPDYMEGAIGSAVTEVNELFNK